MIQYGWTLLVLHTAYVLYLFMVGHVASFSENPIPKEYMENFEGLLKLNCLIYAAWLPLYLKIIW